MKTKTIPKTLDDLPFVFAVSQAEDSKIWGTVSRLHIISLLTDWINQGRRYTTDGITWHAFTKEVEEKESGEFKVWISIYENGPVMHLSRQAADICAHSNRLACIEKSISWTEGEGLTK